MNNYELTYIVKPTLDDNSRKETIERFTSLIEQNGGIVEKVDEAFWGKRRLAYPINDMTEGYYVLTSFKANSEVPREIERNLQISDKILRYLVIKLEEKRRTVKPRAAKPVQEVAEEEAPVESTEE
ncbi:MAG: 30S ribosomal protein S6 [Eubacteriales bacterium]|nr:30S ribosomal protein S6 [Eubacteriales bacterium]